MIVRTASELEKHFHGLGPGDTVVGQLAMAHERAALLLDLQARGVRCVPSALSQVLSRSKLSQVELLGGYMHPLTLAIRRRKDLLNAVNVYCRENIGPVLSKQEHLHCGHGVRRWEHIESLYSCCGLDTSAYPFVLQPFEENFQDLRIIMVDDYEEAYVRHNPYSFRCNLSAGGSPQPHALSPEQRAFCREIIQRAGFPYAHIDLQLMADGTCYLQEIALNGGMRGSRLTRGELEVFKAACLERTVGATEAPQQQPARLVRRK